jgi:hypothetical protein
MTGCLQRPIVSERGQPPYYETDKAQHDKIVSPGARMLKLHKDLPKAKTAPEKTAPHSDER